MNELRHIISNRDNGQNTIELISLIEKDFPILFNQVNGRVNKRLNEASIIDRESNKKAIEVRKELLLYLSEIYLELIVSLNVVSHKEIYSTSFSLKSIELIDKLEFNYSLFKKSYLNSQILPLLLAYVYSTISRSIDNNGWIWIFRNNILKFSICSTSSAEIFPVDYLNIVISSNSAIKIMPLFEAIKSFVPKDYSFKQKSFIDPISGKYKNPFEK